MFARPLTVAFPVTVTLALGSLLGQVTWVQLTPARSPTPRYQAAMAYDVLRDRFVLFGGDGGQQNSLGDTWEFDGTTWAQRNLSPSPPAGTHYTMAYDRGRGRMVMVGGSGATPQTWEYDGAAWRLVNTATQPTGSGADNLVYDASRGVLVLFTNGFGWGAAQTFGGTAYTSGPHFDDTYRYGAVSPADVSVIGPGCAGAAAEPALAPTAYDMPYLGSTLRLSFYSLPQNAPVFLLLGASRTSYLGLPLPLDLSPLGMRNRALRVSAEFVGQVPVVAHRGEIALPVPNQRSLVGREIFAQGLVVEVGGNPANAVMTRALACRFGSR